MISRFAPGSDLLVYLGTRLLLNDDRVDALKLAAGCCRLEIREWIGSGDGRCSRIRPVDGNLESVHAEFSASAHGLNRTIVQHTSAAVTAAEGQEGQQSSIVDEQKIE